MGKDTKNNDATVTTPPENPANGEDGGSSAEPKGLSLRDALEVSIELHKEPKSQDDDTAKTGRDAAQKTASRDSSKTGDGASPASTSADGAGDPGAKPLQPPSEYSPEEKADFLASPRKAQEAALRLDRSRKARIEEIKTAAREYDAKKKEHEDISDLARALTPYIKAIGSKMPTEVAMKKAIELWHSVESSNDPRGVLAQILERKGIKPPDDWKESTSKGSASSDDKNSPLQERLTRVEGELEKEKLGKLAATMRSAYVTLAQEKNGAGQLRYPDFSDPEKQGELGKAIGSLVHGRSELSKDFIARTAARIPDLTLERLMLEAYRYCGGRIDDTAEAPSRTQNTQQHIEKSKRAASSVPGRGAQTTGSGKPKKFGSYREAAAAALAEHREREA